MNRRDMITAVGAGLAIAAVPAFAETPKPVEKKLDARGALLASLQACLVKAQACAAHCEAQLANGNKDFARCSRSVVDLLAIGWATQSVVSRKSVSAKKVVEAFAATCKECSAACLEHKPHFAHGMHLECKECMEACDACLKACEAFAKA
jgi:Cys-rich four helix bundle protein (predicted Tat secretion target)